jgi:hypothetical protein
MGAWEPANATVELLACLVVDAILALGFGVDTVAAVGFDVDSPVAILCVNAVATLAFDDFTVIVSGFRIGTAVTLGFDVDATVVLAFGVDTTVASGFDVVAAVEFESDVGVDTMVVLGLDVFTTVALGLGVNAIAAPGFGVDFMTVSGFGVDAVLVLAFGIVTLPTAGGDPSVRVIRPSTTRHRMPPNLSLFILELCASTIHSRSWSIMASSGHRGEISKEALRHEYRWGFLSMGGGDVVFCESGEGGGGSK